MKAINEFFSNPNYLLEDRNFEKRPSAKALIFDDNKILVLRRCNDCGGGGKWDLPGGGIEKGENKEEALKREVYEETNLTITNIKYIKKENLNIPELGINSEMNFFRCDCLHTQVVLKPSTWVGSDGKPEHTEYKWLSEDHEVENLDCLDVIKVIIKKELNKYKEQNKK